MALVWVVVLYIVGLNGITTSEAYAESQMALYVLAGSFIFIVLTVVLSLVAAGGYLHDLRNSRNAK